MRTSRPVTGLAVAALAAPAAAAIDAPTNWSRESGYTSYHAWAEFKSATGTPTNTPDVAAFPSAWAAPATGTTVANAYDTSGQSFLTGGKNIYSFAAPTNIKVDVPSYNLGSGYVTTVFVQTRTLGSVPTLASARIVYPIGGTSVAPADWGTLSTAPNTGMGGADVDSGFLFTIPTSPDSLKIQFDAASSSMSLDIVTVDAVVTRKTLASPLLPDMNPTVGYLSQSVPEPTSAAALGLGSLGLLARRRRRAVRGGGRAG